MNPDPYRGIWGGRYCRDSPVQPTRSCDCSQDHCQASDRYVEQVDEILNYEVSKKESCRNVYRIDSGLFFIIVLSNQIKVLFIKLGLWWFRSISKELRQTSDRTRSTKWWIIHR